jgi:hypothetical protein
VTFAERLTAPTRWWVLSLVAVVALVVAADISVGATAAAAAGTLVAVGLGTWLASLGRLTVSVHPDGLHIGQAHLPEWAIGEVTVLRGDDAARARGTAADPRAFFCVRGYVPDAVLVAVNDADDPVPYWLVSTRHPSELAGALDAVRAGAR